MHNTAEQKDRKGKNMLGELYKRLKVQINDGTDIDNWINYHFQHKGEDLEILRKCNIHIVVEKQSNLLLHDGFVLNNKNVAINVMNKVYFGKSNECADYVVAHPTISKLHCVLLLHVKDGHVNAYLMDLNSANGTIVNNEKILPFVPKLITLNTMTVTSINDISVDNSLNKIQLGASERVYHVFIEHESNLSAGNVKQSNVLSSVKTNSGGEHSINQGNNGDIYGPGSKSSSNSKVAADDADLTVFVSNIAYETTESSLRSFFRECGNIVSISIPQDRNNKDSGMNKGFAFITFDRITSVSKALVLDGDNMGDRKLVVRRSGNNQNKNKSNSTNNNNNNNNSMRNDTLYQQKDRDSSRDRRDSRRGDDRDRRDNRRGDDREKQHRDRSRSPSYRRNSKSHRHRSSSNAKEFSRNAPSSSSSNVNNRAIYSGAVERLENDINPSLSVQYSSDEDADDVEGVLKRQSSAGYAAIVRDKDRLNSRVDESKKEYLEKYKDKKKRKKVADSEISDKRIRKEIMELESEAINTFDAGLVKEYASDSDYDGPRRRGKSSSPDRDKRASTRARDSDYDGPRR